MQRSGSTFGVAISGYAKSLSDKFGLPLSLTTSGMDALITKANARRPVRKISTGHLKPTSKNSSDHTMNSIVKRTSIPKSLNDKHNLNNASNYKHLTNKKLRIQLTRQSEQAERAKALVQDAEMLLMEDVGGMEVEDELERTWRVGQSEVVQSAGQEAAKGRREYKLDGGPYVSRYARNGRSIQVIFALRLVELTNALDTLLLQVD